MSNSPCDLNHQAELNRRHSPKRRSIDENPSPYDLERVHERMREIEEDHDDESPKGSPYDLNHQAELERWSKRRRS